MFLLHFCSAFIKFLLDHILTVKLAVSHLVSSASWPWWAVLSWWTTAYVLFSSRLQFSRTDPLLDIHDVNGCKRPKFEMHLVKSQQFLMLWCILCSSYSGLFTCKQIRLYNVITYTHDKCMEVWLKVIELKWLNV